MYVKEINKKILAANKNFNHVIALTLDKSSRYKHGFVRCINSREGDVTVKGYIDHSKIYHVVGRPPHDYKIVDELVMKGEKETLNLLVDEGWECIGFEDPDIYYDETDKLYHLYFTIPLKPIDKSVRARMKIHLGHAQGADLHSLKMTSPVLYSDQDKYAKEVSIAPKNSYGYRINLIESRNIVDGVSYSVVQTVKANSLSGPWEYKKIVFHPKEHKISWIGGHASPGPLFPKKFIDVGKNKLLGLINGREANKVINGKVVYGVFSVGLFVYDFELGKIDWVSDKPFIQDSKATTITFASQFIQTKKDKGIIYAHIDDSFIRAYEVTVESINKYLKCLGKIEPV